MVVNLPLSPSYFYENLDLSMIDSYKLLTEFPNLCIVKSMAKDFGIAGIRAGYGIMTKEKINQLLDTGYLWNVSGLTDYFFKLYILYL